MATATKSRQSFKGIVDEKIYNMFSLLRDERTAGDFIPYMNVIKNIATTHDGLLVATLRVVGRPFETVDIQDMNIRHEALNTFLKTIANPNVAIWVHRVRRKSQDTLSVNCGSTFATDFTNRYLNFVNEANLMRSELYISIVYRPYATKAERKLTLAAKRSNEQIKADLITSIDNFQEIVDLAKSSLKRFEVEQLGDYKIGDAVYNEQLSFFNFLITLEWQRIRKNKAVLYSYLGNAQIFAVDPDIQVNSPMQKRFVRMIELKEYDNDTYSGILNGLFYTNQVEPYEYIETQSFAFLSRPDAKKFLTTQRNQLRGSEDGAFTQIAQFDYAIDQLMSGEFAVGEYHYSLAIIGNSPEEVKENTRDAVSSLQEVGLVPVVATISNVGDFFASLPSNFKLRPRIHRLTSRNYAGLAPLSNFQRGKKIGNPWGEAVGMFKTASNQVAFFNFHASKELQNSYDRKELGNTIIIGKSGSGKTVLMLTLLAWMQKYRFDRYGQPTPFNTVYFDKDRGAEAAIRAMGGGYLTVSNGKPTGFNPFQIESTERNIVFLVNLVKMLVRQDGEKISTQDALKIDQAVKAIMRLDKEERNIQVLKESITEGTTEHERDNSIIKRLAKWFKGGMYEWVFAANNEDSIDFAKYQIFGIDGTDFLDLPEICAPISYYLLHRMEDVIDGRRFVYMMDEAWKWINDPVFSDFTNNKQLTIRKQNGLGVFATQQPDHFLSNPYAKSLVGQIATTIFLPNPKATAKEYIEGFKCTQMEYEVIKRLNPDSRMFLVKQDGETVGGDVRSYVASFNLDTDDDRFKNDITVLSGSTDNLELLDIARAEMGEDPDAWLPRFLELVNNR